jgi:hypothetical protein
MLKLNEGFTVYSCTPHYGDRDEIYNFDYETIATRLSESAALDMAKERNAAKETKFEVYYECIRDILYHGLQDPRKWISDSSDYDALVAAGEIRPEEYQQ